MVISSLVFGGIAMFFFEGEDSNEDYGPMELNFVLRIARGCYKGFLSACLRNRYRSLHSH